VTRPPTVIGGRRATLEAIRAGRALEVLVASGSRQTEALREVLEASNAAGVDVKEVPRRELDALGADHQGVAVSVRELVYLRERDLATYPFGDEDVVVVLDGITDPQNFGAAARSAEATGVTMLITRKRRAGGPTPTSPMRGSRTSRVRSRD
jgi:tRNA G18 (ribose-2'-O)-methylase SpoU